MPAKKPFNIWVVVGGIATLLTIITIFVELETKLLDHAKKQQKLEDAFKQLYRDTYGVNFIE